MLDFILRKLLPFGLARSMSIAAVPLFQFTLIAFCGREEAGRFYLLASLALMASQLADLGVARAMPVIFADSDEHMHHCLPEINLFRWFAGLLFGSFFLIFGKFGDVTWQWHREGIPLLLLCSGRTILLGYQGYSHARQSFNNLLRGSTVHFSVIVALSVFFLASGQLVTFSALICLVAGVWVEILLLDRPGARMFYKHSYRWSEAWQYILPFSKVGIYTAVYNRVESLSAGYILDKSSLGLFGTLDSALRIVSWPLYAASQAIFPGIRDMVQNHHAAGLKLLARRYFMVAAVWCATITIAFAGFWHYYQQADRSLFLAGLLLLPAFYLAAPYGFMVSLYYSLQLEKKYARLAFLYMSVRCTMAPVLALFWGYLGLCALPVIVGLVAVSTLWFGCRQPLQELNGDDSSTAPE